MVDRKAFDMIRQMVVQVKNGLLYNMGQEARASSPVVVNVVSVEEDGHLWLLVNSRMKKWNDKVNVPLRIQFIKEDSLIDLNGIGRCVEPDAVPSALQEKAAAAKSVMYMKVYYGEYIPFVTESNPVSWLYGIRKWLRNTSGDIAVFANRRMFIFR